MFLENNSDKRHTDGRTLHRSAVAGTWKHRQQRWWEHWGTWRDLMWPPLSRCGGRGTSSSTSHFLILIYIFFFWLFKLREEVGGWRLPLSSSVLQLPNTSFKKFKGSAASNLQASWGSAATVWWETSVSIKGWQRREKKGKNTGKWRRLNLKCLKRSLLNCLLGGGRGRWGWGGRRRAAFYSAARRCTERRAGFFVYSIAAVSKAPPQPFVHVQAVSQTFLYIRRMKK